MKKWTLKIWLYVILGILTTGTIGYASFMRHEVERENDSIELTLNLEQIEDLAEQSGQETSFWLENLAAAGATSVAIIEETLIDYLEAHFISYTMTGTLRNDEVLLNKYPARVRAYIQEADDYDLVILLDRQEDFSRIYEGLSRYQTLQLLSDESDRIIIIDGQEADLIFEESGKLVSSDGSTGVSYKQVVGTAALELPIGFNKETITMARKAGLKVLLRPINNEKYAADMVPNYELEVSKYDGVVPMLLTTGSQVLGFSSAEASYIEATYDFLERYNFKIGLIESAVQRQYTEVSGLPQQVERYEESYFVRAFTIWPYLQQRFLYPGYEHGEEIGNSIFRAVIERNIRLVYFNPFMWNVSDYVTNLEDYQAVLGDLADRLDDHGYQFGPFSHLRVLNLPTLLRVLLYIEVLLFGLVLLYEGVLPFGRRVGILGILLAILGGVSGHFVAPNMAVKVFALLASMIFASLAAVTYYKVFLVKSEGVKHPLVYGFLSLLGSAAMALLGGLFIGTIMARTDYFLEIELFSGVKLSLIAPILIIGCFVVLEYVKAKAKDAKQHILIELKDTSIALLREPLRIGHVMILGFIGAIGFIYLARSGHESGVEPMTIEIVFRNFLEQILFARPRNKEFLMAFPMMVLGIVYLPWFNRFSLEVKYMVRLMLMAFVAIGVTSITNTFSHIRSPLYLSFIRTDISILAGMVVAVIFLVAIKIGLYLLNTLLNWVEKKVQTDQAN